MIFDWDCCARFIWPKAILVAQAQASAGCVCTTSVWCHAEYSFVHRPRVHSNGKTMRRLSQWRACYTRKHRTQVWTKTGCGCCCYPVCWPSSFQMAYDKDMVFRISVRHYGILHRFCIFTDRELSTTDNIDGGRRTALSVLRIIRIHWTFELILFRRIFRACSTQIYPNRHLRTFVRTPILAN